MEAYGFPKDATASPSLLAIRIDKFLEGDDLPVLDDAGRVSAEYAKGYAESEFEKYRVFQDRLFKSDFDRLMNGDDLLELPEADS